MDILYNTVVDWKTSGVFTAQTSTIASFSCYCHQYTQVWYQLKTLFKVKNDMWRVTTEFSMRMEKYHMCKSCVVSCMWWQLISVADDQNNCYHHTCMLHKQTILVAEYI